MLKKKPRFTRWVPTIWIGTVVGLPVALIAGSAALGARQGEVAQWGLLGLLIGVFGGWLIALLTWLFFNGIYGWKTLGGEFHEAYAEAKEESRLEQQIEDEIEAERLTGVPVAALDQAVAPSPWVVPDGEGHSYNLNPWGCCLDNYDEDGYPIHGGANCQHPEAWKQTDR